jgi:hypothetical protein
LKAADFAPPPTRSANVSGFSEIMRLKEMAEEDIYFARRDRELIAELKRRRGEGSARDQSADPGHCEPAARTN